MPRFELAACHPRFFTTPANMLSFALASLHLMLNTMLFPVYSTQGVERPEVSTTMDTTTAVESKNGTFASVLNRVTGGKQVFGSMLTHLEELNGLLGGSDPKNGCELVCEPMVHPHLWNFELKAFQWKLPEDCVHFIHADSPPVNFSKPRDVFITARDFHLALEPFGSSVAKSYGISWQKVLSVADFDYDTLDKYRHCRLARAQGYRINGSWAVSTVFTNLSTDIAVQYRGILQEVISGRPSGTPMAREFNKLVCECLSPSSGTGCVLDH